MSGHKVTALLMEKARELSGEEFVRMIEGRRAPMTDLISIEDLAAELAVSVRTLRRWNNRSDAPKRFKRGRQLMYRRADVARWIEQVRRAG
jgi:hypothetical protein